MDWRFPNACSGGRSVATLTLLDRPDKSVSPSEQTAGQELHTLSERLLAAAAAGAPDWAAQAAVANSAAPLMSATRALEHDFVVGAITALETELGRPLRVLDVGGGYSPLAHWLSRRGHDVVAIDHRTEMIEALLHSGINDFYASRVSYRVAQYELLDFDSATFDVVTCLGALAQLPAGNDRLALWEFGRVLEPDGALILTFAVSPRRDEPNGESRAPLRRPGQAFTPELAQALLMAAVGRFVVSGSELPAGVASLTADDVASFWHRVTAKEGRVHAVHDWLPLGAVLRRRRDETPLIVRDIVSALLDGQRTLRDTLEVWKAEAGRDARVSSQLELQVSRLTTELHSLATRTEESESLAAARLRVVREQEQLIDTYRLAAEGRLQLVQDLEDQVHRLRLEVEELHDRRLTIEAAASDRLRLIEEHERALEEYKSIAAERGESLKQLEERVAALSAQRQDAQTAAEARLEVIEEQEQALAHLRSALQQRLEQIQELERQRAALEASAIERLVASQQNALLDLTQQVAGLANQYERAREDTQDAARARIAEIEASLGERLAMAEAAAAARLAVIEQQEQALQAFRRAHWRLRLKAWAAPRLGVLYQYAPRPMSIPDHYRRLPSLSNPPLISIVTPSYNQGAFIERTLKSVFDQEYPRLEYIVQDGASTDETLSTLDLYRAAFTHVESKPDKGFVHAINMGFQHATGEIMAYLNSDDLLLPGSLHYVGKYFAEHPDVDVVYGHRIIIDEYDAEIGRWILPPHDDEVLSWADYVPQETLFWRQRAWESIGQSLDESFRFAVDWDLLVRLRYAGARFVRLPRFIGAFRVHPHSKTSAQMEEIGSREMERIRGQCHGRAVTHAEIRSALRPYMRTHVLLHKLYRLGVVRY
jgi:SAM-dependent methyltransferase